MKKTLALVFLALACCTSAPQPIPTVQPAAVPRVPDWRAKVTAARALDDPEQKNAAFLALLREALPHRDVQLSGTSDLEYVHRQDNQPAPIVNFDPRLQQKQSARQRSGGNTRSLQGNFGYFFSQSGVPYVVIGPAALDPRSPTVTRLAAEHELFHAEMHVGDPRSNDDTELETWSVMFVRFFNDLYPLKQTWRPMLNYYEKASEDERQKAVARLASYYRNSNSVTRAAMDEWLIGRKTDRSSSKLIADLETALNS